MTDLPLGITIELSAGLHPGPLLTHVLITALQRGFGAGVWIACSLIVTGAFVIVVVLTLLRSVPDAVVCLLSQRVGERLPLALADARALDPARTRCSRFQPTSGG